MKLKEIEDYYKNLTEAQLFEEIGKTNDTPISTQDLIKVIANNHSNNWKEIPEENFDAYIDSLVTGTKHNEQS